MIFPLSDSEKKSLENLDEDIRILSTDPSRAKIIISCNKRFFAHYTTVYQIATRDTLSTNSYPTNHFYFHEFLYQKFSFLLSLFLELILPSDITNFSKDFIVITNFWSYYNTIRCWLINIFSYISYNYIPAMNCKSLKELSFLTFSKLTSFSSYIDSVIDHITRLYKDSIESSFKITTNLSSGIELVFESALHLSTSNMMNSLISSFLGMATSHYTELVEKTFSNLSGHSVLIKIQNILLTEEKRWKIWMKGFSMPYFLDTLSRALLCNAIVSEKCLTSNDGFILAFKNRSEEDLGLYFSLFGSLSESQVQFSEIFRRGVSEDLEFLLQVICDNMDSFDYMLHIERISNFLNDYRKMKDKWFSKNDFFSNELEEELKKFVSRELIFMIPNVAPVSLSFSRLLILGWMQLLDNETCVTSFQLKFSHIVNILRFFTSYDEILEESRGPYARRIFFTSLPQKIRIEKLCRLSVRILWEKVDVLFHGRMQQDLHESELLTKELCSSLCGSTHTKVSLLLLSRRSCPISKYCGESIKIPEPLLSIKKNLEEQLKHRLTDRFFHWNHVDSAIIVQGSLGICSKVVLSVSVVQYTLLYHLSQKAEPYTIQDIIKTCGLSEYLFYYSIHSLKQYDIISITPSHENIEMLDTIQLNSNYSGPFYVDAFVPQMGNIKEWCQVSKTFSSITASSRNVALEAVIVRILKKYHSASSEDLLLKCINEFKQPHLIDHSSFNKSLKELIGQGFIERQSDFSYKYKE